MFFAGTRHSSKTTSHVAGAIPSLSFFWPTVSPGAVRSTRNAVMPRYPAAGSTVAKTMKMPASTALLIHSLRPDSSQLSPRSSAWVVSAKASLPEPASDNAYAPTVFFASFGRYR